MKIVAKTWGLSGISAMAFMLLAMSSGAETTVLNMADQLNAEKAAVAANPQPETSPAVSAPGLPVINSPVVQAQTATGGETPVMAAPAAPVVAAPVAPSAPVVAAVPAPSVPEAAADVADKNVKLDDPARTGSGEDVPPQVTAVVEKLRGAKVDLSLEDMNQARAALARLDLLLELEQKMHDLQQARAKNETASLGNDISGLLPTQMAAASRRGAMPIPLPVALPAANPAPVTASVTRPQAVPSQYEIQRINGINGRYSAVLRSKLDSKTSTVRVGDTLSDGSEVTAITPSAIKLRDPSDGKVSTIKIENVSAVSDGRRTY